MNKLLLIFMIGIGMYADAQVNLDYQMPHDDILSLADAPLPPLLQMNSSGDEAFVLYRKSYKSIEELSEDEMRLAGLRINPKTNISSRARYFYNMEYYDMNKLSTIAIKGIPENAKLSNFNWSRDQTKVAFTNTTEKGVQLYVLDMASKTAKRITEDYLNANMGRPFLWSEDGQSLLVRMVPEGGINLIDADNTVPTGPTISVNEAGTKAQNRTYQDLLKNRVDEENFESLATSVIYRVNLDGSKSIWLKEDMYRSMMASPDGNYIMVATVERPFSYIVPYSRFPTNYKIYTKEGALVKTFLEAPLIEELPKGFMSCRTGIRNVSWRDDKPATLYWAEALDGGDPANEVAYRDAVYQQAAPFTEEKQLLLKTKLRFSGIEWGTDQLAIAYDYWWNTRTIRTSIFNPMDPKQEVKLFNERNYQDNYADPGSFVSEKNQWGRYVLEVVNNHLYLIGDGYSDEGKLPFVDAYDIKTGKTERLYRAKPGDMLENISRALDVEKGDYLIRLESSSDYPNYYVRNIKTGKVSPITKIENPFKAIQNVEKEVITYQREDGIELSATLYLPVGYDKTKKEKMPMIMWAYPREYKDKSTAGQVTSSSNEFTYPYYGSPLYWVNRGYVVLDDAAFPIVGEGDEEPNDTFIPQLVANAKAAIDAVDEMGYIDRERVAVGGHSYGAFMTANLLTHSDLFAAGIARSGAYNRTLTPFGFQSEERSYWEAPHIYYEMSPFMHCDKMKTPLLLIHGEADNNSGTYPMQSERYFNALKGLGAPVKLVMLPKESHGYAARESIMHMLWEQDQWLETYVKNKGKEQSSQP
jgi:dipeptidyl aminopeptidase/acylaminoacyl peptidase